MRDARLDLVRLARLFHAPKRLEHPVQQMTNQCGRLSPSVSRNGFFLADNEFEPDVKYVEENPNVAVAFQVTPVRRRENMVRNCTLSLQVSSKIDH